MSRSSAASSGAPLRPIRRPGALAGSDQRTEHQLQDGSLAERIRDDFEATAFLDKEAFKQVRRPDGPPMRHRESQVGDAGLVPLALIQSSRRTTRRCCLNRLCVAVIKK